MDNLRNVGIGCTHVVRMKNVDIKDLHIFVIGHKK